MKLRNWRWKSSPKLNHPDRSASAHYVTFEPHHVVFWVYGSDRISRQPDVARDHVSVAISARAVHELQELIQDA